ncbi:MAG TPA: radical SAM protein, partial [Bacillota bacterium]|nr:radical SAM protein [Bacillota bacterium]
MDHNNHQGHPGAAGHPGGHPGHIPAGHPGRAPKGDDKNPLRLLFWELTSGCNLRCIHCRAVAQPERIEGEASTQECYDIIDNLVSFADPILVLTGGEPLFRPDFFDIASYATSKGLRIAMATNGTLVTEEIAKKVKEVGVQRVSISLDGATAATHDAFRGIPGSFEAALQGFRNLKAQGIGVQFNTCVAKHNLHEIKDVLKLAVDVGAEALHIFMLVPVGCGVEIADEQMVSAETYEELLNWFYDESRKVPIELKATCAPHYHRVMRQRAKEEGTTLTLQSHGLAAVTRGCLAGSGVAFLSSKGQVQPCGYL